MVSARVDSSNFNPMLGWMHGAQMVAFNMQVWLVRTCACLMYIECCV
jgi:hypothetical protein